MRHEIIAATALTLASCGASTDPGAGGNDFTAPVSGLDGREPSSEPQQPGPQGPTATMTVKGRHLYSACGEQITLRGVNKMNIWTDRDGTRSFAEIAKTGANTVRIVWDTTGDAAELDGVITKAAAAGLLPMVELHDATGNWDGLPALVSYWTSPEVIQVVQKHQRYLLVNIGNEVGGHGITQQQFESGYSTAIAQMRAAGIHTPLVVDSVQWGYDIDMVQAAGANVIAADPDRNVIFSVHAYWGGWPAEQIWNEIEETVALGLPLIVGEFAHQAVDCVTPIDYDALLQATDAYDIGWYAWEWGPGNTPCAEMDMTSDNSIASLWGWAKDVALDHACGIAATAKPVRSLSDASCGG